jgi:DNA modification methylase
MIESKKFNTTIRHHRLKNQLLLRHVAANLGIDVALISKFERGQRMPTRKQVIKLGELYKIPVNKLVNEWLVEKLSSKIKLENNSTHIINRIKRKILIENSIITDEISNIKANTKFRRKSKIRINHTYNENCLLTMQRMKNNLVDLVLTSPPYDSMRTYEGFTFPFEPIAIELFRILKEGGVIVWIVADSTKNGSETLSSFKQALFFKKIGFNIHDTMIYQKNYYINSNVDRYYSSFEYMFVLSKGKPKTANLILDRKNNTAGQIIHGTQRTKKGALIPKSGIGKKKVVKEFGKRGNVWSYTSGRYHSTKDAIAFNHPAILPEKLVEDHIITWSNPKDIIYDCFAGSGTTAKIATKLRRRWIQSEISKKYTSIIKDRLKL